MTSREARPTILVVDDEKDICSNLADIFGELGYLVDTAHQGEAALELVRQKAYDIALLDLKMPGMDGLELYRRIKEIRSGTVAIVVTAYASSDTAAEVLAAGAWRVLSKPVEFRNLLKLVETAIDQPLVLVVDDDRDLCANLWDMLRERGYRVDLAHDEEEAAKLLSDKSFHVVLIDMKLPGGDGSRVFRRVQAVGQCTRTILITAYPAETDKLVEHVLREGANAVCYKPFDIPHLLQVLETVKPTGTSMTGADD